MFSSRMMRLAAGLLILLLSAFVFAGKLLDVPFASMGWSVGELKTLSVLSAVIFFLSGVFSAWFSRRVSSQLRLLVATVLSVSGVYIASFTAPGFSVPLYAGRMLLFPAGAGIGLQTVIFTLLEWFEDKRLLFALVLPVPIIVSLVLAAGPMQNIFSARWEWSSVYRLYALILGFATAGGMLFLDAPEKDTPGRRFPIPGTIVFFLSGAIGIILNIFLCT